MGRGTLPAPGWAKILGHPSRAHRRGLGNICAESPHLEGQPGDGPGALPPNAHARGKPSTWTVAEQDDPAPGCAPSDSPPLRVPRDRPARRAKDTVPAPERRRAGAGGASHVRHLETTATRGVALGPLRPGLQAQSPLAARRRGPPPLARPAPAGLEAPGWGVAVSRRLGVEHPPGPREGVPHGTTTPRAARAPHLRPAALSGAEHYNSRHAVNVTAEAPRRRPALRPARLSRRVPSAALAARGAGTRAMEEPPSPLLGCSKPHLEKLTLGITRILGEWGGEPWGRPRDEAGSARNEEGRWTLNVSRHRCGDFRC